MIGTGASYGSFWSNHEGSWMLWLGLVMVLLAFGSQKVDLSNTSFFYPEKKEDKKNRSETAQFPQGLHASIFWKHAWYYFQIPGLFWAYNLIISSPFLRMSVVYDEPFDYANGLGLVPALQDTALACHPPLLFFGLAFCALIWYLGMILFSKETSAYPIYAQKVFLWYEWAIGCTFGILTVGLAWGGFWAYSELGWGSYWFWDPVENAGLLPWLVVACLFHRQVQRKRSIQVEKNLIENHGLWIIGGISLWPLSLFSTWGVRSGIFTSVHSFAAETSKTFALISLVSFFVFLWCFYATIALLRKSNVRHPKGKYLQQGLWVGLFFILWVAFGTYGPILWTVLGQDELHVGAAFFNPWVGAVGIVLGWLLIQSNIQSQKRARK
uniref:Heme lyase CcmF n=1 Tax=Hemiarma marina TaxID=1848298 RepID=A0A679EJT0_9CRYP